LTQDADELRRAGRLDEALQAALDAVATQINRERTLPILARILAAQEDFSGALEIYRQALALETDNPAISAEMGRLALRLGKYDLAEEVLTIHVGMAPPTPAAIADLAWAQAGRREFGRAQETLKSALQTNPGQALLWSALAQILCLDGHHAQATIFFEEALSLDIRSTPALSGLADALLLGGGDVERALSASEAALAGAATEDIPIMTDAHAGRLLAIGRLEAGWKTLAKAFEPGEAAMVTVKIAAPRWTPGMPLDGRLLLIFPEDEVEAILLAQVVPSVIVAGAPLILAVDPRWESLARRSFPDAITVPLLSRQHDGRLEQTATLDGPHVHEGELVGAWSSLRSMMPIHRARLADFADGAPYLKVDPERVRRWRDRLAALGSGQKVGVVWRARNRARAWEAPPLQALEAALSVHGVQLIGLQEEAFPNEFGWLQENFGMRIHDPSPELQGCGLEDLAALTLALDAVIGPPHAATCLSAACGAETWFLTTPRPWALLGAKTFPWFPTARVLSAAAPDDWTAALDELRQALGDLVARSSIG
jgi:tetratricopeptide (TPR) repeat protein